MLTKCDRVADRNVSEWPILGCGVGLRTPHYPVITTSWPQVDWFEAVTENYMDTGGRPIDILEKIRSRYPVALHGVALSIGSADRLNERYLARWKTLVDRIDPFVVSDHISWSAVAGEELHDLLPLPFTEEALDLLVRRVEEIQEFLGRKILLENVSSYISFTHSTIPEWEFIRALAERSGCGLLLDINNVYVNSINHGFDPHEYIRNIPGTLVGQIHLAGHTDRGKYLFDTHSAPIIEKVWNLYREALSRWGIKSTLIEWDENIPDFDRLMAEARHAKLIYNEAPRSFDTTPWFKHTLEWTPQATTPSAIENAPSLKAAEEWLKDNVLPKKENVEPSLGGVHVLNTQAGDPGHLRIDVYREGYLARTAEALGEVYEAIKRILGSDAFREMAEAYARSYSSPSYNLNERGRDFPAFLAALPLTEKYAFLPDLARLEWAIAESFHATLKPALEPARLSVLGSEESERIHFVFQPSVHVLESPWPILDLWQARKKEADEAVTLDAPKRRQYILIARKADSQVFCDTMEEKQFAVLTALLGGKSLGEALETLLDDADDDTTPVGDWFSRWMSLGLISDIRLSETVR